MSYTRPCNKCGERISLREMPHGQWVAFDVSTEETHVCGVQHEPDVAVKLKGKNKSKIEKDGEDFGIKIDDLDEDTIDKTEDEDDEEEGSKEKVVKKKTKTYDSVSGIHHCINEGIEKKQKIFIEYYSKWKDEHSSRELSPITKFKYRDKNYLQAYCHLDKAVRIFSTSSIEEATLLDKKLFRPKKIPKPDIAKFVEKSKKDESDKLLKEIELDQKKEERKEKRQREKDLKRIEKEEKVREKNESDQLPGWILAVAALFIMAFVKTCLGN